MKTISQASKIGWLESKVIALFGYFFGEPETQHKEESPLGALVSAAGVRYTFPTKTECFIGSTGQKHLRPIQFEMAYGGNGEPLPIAINSLADDPKYVQCKYCDIYMTPVDYHRHIGNVSNKEIATRNDRIPGIPACKNYPVKAVSTGRAVWANGRYRELFKDERVIDMAMVERIPTVKNEDAEDFLTDPENLEDEREGHTFPEVGYERIDQLGNTWRYLGKNERLIEIPEPDAYHGALERLHRQRLISEVVKSDKPVMVRFVRDSYNAEPNNYFSVELNGKLRKFTLEEDYKSDFHPMFRFTKGVTEHRLCHNGSCVALIDVSYDVHSSATVTKATNKNGELTEFFLPSTHEFFKYVIVEATASEIL